MSDRDELGLRLYYACRDGKTAEAKRLIAEGAPVDWQNENGFAPLHWASSNGHTEIVMLLLRNQCNLNVTSKKGNTPLILAAWNNKMDTVRALVEAGCDITIRDNTNKTAAEWAKEQGHHTTAEYLTNEAPRVQARLRRLQAEAERQKRLQAHAERQKRARAEAERKREAQWREAGTQKYGRKVFDLRQALLKASREGKTAEVKILIDRGAAVNCKDWNGQTPLCLASSQGYTDTLKRLIKYQADVNMASQGGNTPLVLAARNNHMATVRALVEAFACITALGEDYRTAAKWAEQKSHHVVAQYLRTEAPLVQAQAGEKFLNFAKTGNVEGVRQCLDQGTTINWQDRYGKSSLYIASKAGNTAIVHLLIDRKACVNIADQYQKTPIMTAASNNKKAVVEALVNARADLNIRGGGGLIVKHKTALEWANKGWGTGPIAAYLSTAMQRRQEEEEERKREAVKEYERKAREDEREAERKEREAGLKKIDGPLRNRAEIASNLDALRSWHQLSTGTTVTQAEKRLESALNTLEKIQVEVKLSFGSLNGAGRRGWSHPVMATLHQSQQALANAEANVRSILSSLAEMDATVDTADEDDMDKLEAATKARDETCDMELKSVEAALNSIESALEKPGDVLTAASHARDNAFSDEMTDLQLVFEEIGGDWNSIGNQGIGADPSAYAVPDWNSIDSAWKRIKIAFVAEHKAITPAMDCKNRGEALVHRFGLYNEWKRASQEVNIAAIEASRVYTKQQPLAIVAARRGLRNIAALAQNVDAAQERIRQEIEYGVQHLKALQTQLKNLRRRARAIRACEKSASKYEEKYLKIEDERRNLKATLEKKQRDYTNAVRRRQRDKTATLKVDVANAEKALREFAKRGDNKFVVKRLLALSKFRPELAFYNSSIDPFAGTSGGGRRVRNFKEYNRVVRLPATDARRGSASPKNEIKLYYATVVADDDARNGSGDAKGAISHTDEDTQLDAVLAAVLEMKLQGKSQVQFIQQLRKIYRVQDILKAIQIEASDAANPRSGDAKAPPRSPPRREMPCVLKAFEGVRGIKDMRRAVHVMGNLSHPNVINLQGVCRDDEKGRWFVQLPRYPCDLWKWALDERKATMSAPGTNGRTPAETWQGRCARMLGSILRGLDYLHSRGVVHRDFKPQNVLVGPPLVRDEDSPRLPRSNEEYPVICDFETCTVEELSSGTTTTRKVVSDGFVDPRLLLDAVKASSVTDMYSFGVVMAEVLLGRRLEKNNAIQDVLNSKDAKRSTSKEQRDVIVSLLREPEYKGNPRRPTAAELLRLPFFSSGPAAIRKCIVCGNDKPLNQVVQCCKPVGRADDGKGDAMSSQSPHFMCNECFSDYVTSEATNHSKTCIVCPATAASEAGERKFIKCPSPPYADDVIAAHASRPAFEAYMRAKAQAAETDAERRAQAELKQELEKIIKMDAKQREVYSARKHIVNTLLVDMCPRCHLAVSPPNFAEDCFALYCPHQGCGCGFCAWCFADCGSDAHQHVANCEYNLEEGKRVYSTEAKFMQARVTRLTQAVRAYLTENAAIAQDVVRACIGELADAGLQDLVREYA